MSLNKERIKKIKAFLKESWCVDEKCNLKGFGVLSLNDDEQHRVITFELNDSQRGKFFVSISHD